MASPEFATSIPEKPNLETIRELKEKAFIKDGSPFWWSTDYSPDPREYLSFEEFRSRLIHLGECKITKPMGFPGDPVHQRDVYLYPEPYVPISLLDLEIEGQLLTFLVTARPYHKKELDSIPYSLFLAQHPLNTLPEFVRSNGVISLHSHFYPHIRGLFAGSRGNHFFWYPLRINSYWEKFGSLIAKSLERKKLSFLGLYEPPYWEELTHNNVWSEFEEKEKRRLVDQHKPALVDFEYLQVSVDEFLEGFQESNKDLMVFYPLRLPGIDNTLPLVIATRTHKESRLRKPVVLGIYAENGPRGYGWKGGILRIKNLRLAEAISKAISEDFGVPVDTVLFTPQKGRPKYERVTA